MADLSSLDILTNEAILENLSSRYARDHIYVID